MNRHSLLLILIALVVLLPGLGVRDFWTAAEGRAPLVARDILASGRILPPFLGARPYLNKPPLFHALVALTFRLTGRQNEFVARLPAVACALLTLLFTAALGRALGGERAGICAALCLLASSRFFSMARSAELDGLFAAATTGCSLGLLRGWSDPDRRWWLLVGVCAAVATLTKGPVLALAFPALFLLAEIIGRRGLRPRMKAGALALLAGVALATLAFYLPLLLQDDYRASLLQRAAFANVRHQRSPLYYLYQLPLALLPALLLFPVASSCVRRSWASLGTPLRAALLAVVMLSLSPSKQSHYLLPLLPWLAIPLGAALAQALLAGRRVILGLIPVLTAGSATVAVLIIQARSSYVGTHPWVWISLGLVDLSAFSLGAWLLRTRRRREPLGIPWAWCLAVPVFASMVLVETLHGGFRNPWVSPAPAMRAFARQARQGPLASLEGKPSALYYLARRDLQLLDSPAAAASWLEAHPGGHLIVPGRRDGSWPEVLARFPREDHWSSPDGHRSYVLLALTRHRAGSGRRQR